MTAWKPDPPCAVCGVLHCPNPAHGLPRPLIERIRYQWRLACGLTCPGHDGSEHSVSSPSELTVVKVGQRFGVLCKSCKAKGGPYRGPVFD